MSRPVEFRTRPTRFSVGLTVTVTLLMTWLLVDGAGLTRRVGYGGGGAALLAGLLWLLASDRWRVAGGAITGLALPIAGACLLAGFGYTVSGQVRGTVPDGSIFLVLGATIALFGAIVTIGDVLDRDTLGRCLGNGLRTTVVVAGAMTLAAGGQFGSGGAIPNRLFEPARTALFTPEARLPLASFLLLLGAGIYGTRAAITHLPVAEVLDRRLDPATRRLLAAVDRRLSQLFVPVALLVAGTTLLELQQSAPYAWLPDGFLGLLGGVVGAEPLRVLLAVIAVTAGLAAAAARSLRAMYRRSGRERLGASAPYASGLAVTAAVVWYHDPLVSALTDRIERRLPAQLAVPFRDLLTEALSVYGGQLVALVVVTVFLVVSLVALVLVLSTVVLGRGTDAARGASVAAAGLFLTATFAAVLAVPLWRSLVGVLAALLVWDAGEFGATFGSELGSRAVTARTELVHCGATLLVGVGVIVLALPFTRALGQTGAESTTGVIALVWAVAAALLLVVASR